MSSCIDCTVLGAENGDTANNPNTELLKKDDHVLDDRATDAAAADDDDDNSSSHSYQKITM